MKVMNTVEGIHYQTNLPVRITVDQGTIVQVEMMGHPTSLQIVAPGLVDLQVNGFQGIDFNEEQLSEKDIIAVTEKLWEVGVTGYMPTLITNSESFILNSTKKISKACEHRMIGESIVGIHLEGPFISREDGPRGAHPVQFIQEPKWEFVELLQSESQGRIKLLTMSPEYEKSEAFINKCVIDNIRVAIGHTAADSEQISRAVKAGAGLSTHLGNAAHLSLPRHPNYIWDQLASDELWSSIISDGFHLPDAVIKVFLRVKPEKTILVSDLTKFAGLSPGIYQSPIGGSVELTSSGRLCMVENQELLAGSASTLRSCIEHLVKRKLTSLTKALEMSTIKPINFINSTALSSGLEVGDKADLLLFDWNKGRMKIKKTIKSGKLVFSAS